jgi:hypothetical protein
MALRSQVIVVILPMVSSDIGQLQINGSWLPTLRARFGSQPACLDDPCINLDAGARSQARDLGDYCAVQV